jgi:hypothetical protein
MSNDNTVALLVEGPLADDLVALFGEVSRYVSCGFALAHDDVQDLAVL